MKAPVGRAASIGIVIGAVDAAVVGGLVMLPAPSEERTQRLDERQGCGCSELVTRIRSA